MTFAVGQAGELRGTSLEALQHFGEGLHLVALARLGTLEAASEAAQETLTRAVVALRHGGTPANLPAFVAGIARHVIADMLRSRARTVSLDTILDSLATRDPDPLSALIAAEERARVRAALVGLAPSDRNVLCLCYIEGLSPYQVAMRSGEPAARVRKRKSRALKRLRAEVVRIDGGTPLWAEGHGG